MNTKLLLSLFILFIYLPILHSQVSGTVFEVPINSGQEVHDAYYRMLEAEKRQANKRVQQDKQRVRKILDNLERDKQSRISYDNCINGTIDYIESIVSNRDYIKAPETSLIKGAVFYQIESIDRISREKRMLNLIYVMRNRRFTSNTIPMKDLLYFDIDESVWDDFKLSDDKGAFVGDVLIGLYWNDLYQECSY